jgi:hypothetical protein
MCRKALALGTDVADGGSVIDKAIFEVRSLDARVVALGHDEHVTSAFASYVRNRYPARRRHNGK